MKAELSLKPLLFVPVFVIAMLFFGFGYRQDHPRHTHRQSQKQAGNHGHIHATYANHKCTKEELAMAPDFGSYFDDFIADSKKYNLPYNHAYCLEWIKFYHSHNVQGVTDLCDGTIEINDRLAKDSIGMKFVMYHELGHWFGLEHGEGIMKENYNSSDTEWVKENWDELVKNHFDKLNNL